MHHVVGAEGPLKGIKIVLDAKKVYFRCHGIKVTNIQYFQIKFGYVHRVHWSHLHLLRSMDQYCSDEAKTCHHITLVQVGFGAQSLDCPGYKASRLHIRRYN